jgi:hypothetical protein
MLNHALWSAVLSSTSCRPFAQCAVDSPTHLGRLLVPAPDGSAIAVAAAARRLAVLPIDAVAMPGSGCGVQVTVGEPVVFAGGSGLAVAGARDCSGGTGGPPPEPSSLGAIWDAAWLGGTAETAAAGGDGGSGVALHLAVLTHARGQQSSELLLLRWARGAEGRGALQQLQGLALPHGGRGTLVGVPGRLAPLPRAAGGGRLRVGGEHRACTRLHARVPWFVAIADPHRALFWHG